eukprot:880544-Alexandrium_andersonii.AAC.1
MVTCRALGVNAPPTGSPDQLNFAELDLLPLKRRWASTTIRAEIKVAAVGEKEEPCRNCKEPSETEKEKCGEEASRALREQAIHAGATNGTIPQQANRIAAVLAVLGGET